jgi:hypothetical protein
MAPNTPLGQITHSSSDFEKALNPKTMNYDPTLINSDRAVTQTVELTFQQWEFSATKLINFRVNRSGLSVIEFAIEKIEEELEYEGEGEIVLTSPAGNTLRCALDEFDLRDMLVHARIVAIASALEPDMGEF